MQFDDDKIDTSELEDRRGMSRGTAVGGGMGIIGVILALFFGINVAGDGGQQQASPQQQTGAQAASDLAQRCARPGALQQYDDCFVLKSFNETNEIWTSLFADSGQRYPKPKMVFFSGQVSTGCGAANSQMGPFYCPPDQKVYIDLDFLNQLQRSYGANGRYAQSYIVAHEVGHHIQTVTGTERKVRQLQQRNPRQQNALSVRMELQADCYAGVWGRLANDRGNVRITRQEFDQAMNAAAAVGDDRIMEKAGQRARPEAFTHGSAAQRQEWFNRGFNTGDYSSCDTFSS